jgi:hypothetical protein
MRARIGEIGVKTKKLGLNHVSRGLFVIVLNLKGLCQKKLRARL